MEEKEQSRVVQKHGSNANWAESHYRKRGTGRLGGKRERRNGQTNTLDQLAGVRAGGCTTFGSNVNTTARCACLVVPGYVGTRVHDMSCVLCIQGGAPADKAKKTAQAVLSGLRSKKSTKVRTSTTFHRPKTLKRARKPLYQRKSAPRANKLDQFQIIKYVQAHFSNFCCMPPSLRPGGPGGGCARLYIHVTWYGASHVGYSSRIGTARRPKSVRYVGGLRQKRRAL